MAWSFEFRAGLAWAIVILIVMVVAIWAEIQVKNILPLLIPIIGYLVFVAWVFRIKK